MDARTAADIRAGIAMARNFKFRLSVGSVGAAQAILRDAMAYGNVTFEAFRREMER